MEARRVSTVQLLWAAAIEDESKERIDSETRMII